MLDIGCATGELLDVFQESSFDVYGVEISSEGVKKCVEKFGENKIIGRALKKTDFHNSFFDIITLSDVFEHQVNPNGLINIIVDILKPGGFLMIVTPDTSSISNKLMRMNWPHYKVEHLFYYNRLNIIALLADSFDPVIMSSAYKTLTLKYCSNILKAYSKNRFTLIVARLFDSLPQKIQFCAFVIKAGEMFVLLRKK